MFMPRTIFAGDSGGSQNRTFGYRRAWLNESNTQLWSWIVDSGLPLLNTKASHMVEPKCNCRNHRVVLSSDRMSFLINGLVKKNQKNNPYVQVIYLQIRKGFFAARIVFFIAYRWRFDNIPFIWCYIFVSWDLRSILIKLYVDRIPIVRPTPFFFCYHLSLLGNHSARKIRNKNWIIIINELPNFIWHLCTS